MSRIQPAFAHGCAAFGAVHTGMCAGREADDAGGGEEDGSLHQFTSARHTVDECPPLWATALGPSAACIDDVAAHPLLRLRAAVPPARPPARAARQPGHDRCTVAATAAHAVPCIVLLKVQQHCAGFRDCISTWQRHNNKAQLLGPVCSWGVCVTAQGTERGSQARWHLCGTVRLAQQPAFAVPEPSSSSSSDRLNTLSGRAGR